MTLHNSLYRLEDETILDLSKIQYITNMYILNNCYKYTIVLSCDIPIIMSTPTKESLEVSRDRLIEYWSLYKCTG